jgi:hypothetical protein
MSVAKYVFWGQLGSGSGRPIFSQIIEIPDEEIQGLSEQELWLYLLKKHNEWRESNSFGGWERVEDSF